MQIILFVQYVDTGIYGESQTLVFSTITPLKCTLNLFFYRKNRRNCNYLRIKRLFGLLEN